MKDPITRGAHHIGLTVSDLEASAEFFTNALGWEVVRRDPDYPAIFVSDGTVLVTLWRVKNTMQYQAFNKNDNIGLHHVAFLVESEEKLNKVFGRVSDIEGVEIEFGPELLRQGPAKHMMCYEPSGIRVEFIWPGT
jgi:catechol 2,3-dioxygenase-like lactoylglutathione lyase family enzyme